MTKAEFVELVQKNGEYESKAAAERAVKAFIDSVTEALTKKELIEAKGNECEFYDVSEENPSRNSGHCTSPADPLISYAESRESPRLDVIG